MKRRVGCVLAWTVTLALMAAPQARAQASARGGTFLRAHAVELDVGAAWLGGVDFGTLDATLTANQSAHAPYTLFKTASSLGATGGVEGRLGFLLTQVVGVEGAFGYARPTLETSVTADVEGAPGTTARERLSQFSVTVSGVAHLWPLLVKGAVPFVLAGAGYLRELHEGNVLPESGHTLHVGGGLKLPLVVRRGFVRALGVRLEGRAVFRSGGADLDASKPTRVAGAAGASVIVQF
jgi:hypothetical protein